MGAEQSSASPRRRDSARQPSLRRPGFAAGRTPTGPESDAPSTGPLRIEPIHFLYGHDLPVRCVDVCEEFDIVVSGSDDETIICHDLKSGRYVRSIDCRDNQGLEHRGARRRPSMRSDSDECGVKWLGVTATRKIVAYTAALQLSVYSINGELEARVNTEERL